MIRKHDFKTYEEAVEEAQALLLNSRREEAKLTTTEHRRKDDRGEYLPFSYIEDEETGATAYISPVPEGYYTLTFLSGDEAKEENRTYPFRAVDKERIPFLMALHTPLFKPTKEIKPDEALTPEGVKAIYAFFGNDGEELPFTPIDEIKNLSIEEAFEEWEGDNGEIELGSLLLRPYPQELTERTGVQIKKASDYAKALEKLLSVKMSKEQTKEAKEGFIFYASELLLRYAIYEFFRTEDYNHLKEVLAASKTFFLPEQWEEGFKLFYCYRNFVNKEKIGIEEYVIAKYLSKHSYNIAGSQARLKEIADYTNTPLPLMGRANKIKNNYDF